ncbi:MAG: hypothetical protein KJ927_02260, partial [Candidatus Eisenbacteria bacterium]|nr:hypothetical protein [Candidatus Eisenbacteria bacterium]
AVRVVLKSGLQGELSREITVTPGLFSILIENGRESASSARVRLDLQAPAGTQGVYLGNDADLSAAALSPFNETTFWDLEPNEGSHTVYAQFVNAEGSRSSIVHDDIILDTQASIRTLVISPDTSIFHPGETVTFTMDAGESGGEASIVIGQDGRRKTLHDAADGIYSLDYLIEEDLRVVDATLTGYFADAAGNNADPLVISRRMTVDPGPTAVTLSVPTSPSPTSIHLSWTQALDGEAFFEYRVIRAEAADVPNQEGREVRTAISQRSQTEFVDTSVEPGKEYYYIVQVVDSYGMKANSNEVMGRSATNAPPSPVTLNHPTNISEDGVGLSWSRSLAPDFSFYRIVRGQTDDPMTDPERIVLNEIHDASSTIYEDTRELKQGTTFWYVVVVVDDLGTAAASNIVSADIPNLAPQPVSLNGPSVAGETSLALNWSRSNDLDFAAYHLHRALSSGVGEADLEVGEITRLEVTQLLDTGLTENTEYYYRLFVEDESGLSTGSNEIAARTANADPPAVTLQSVVQDDDAFTPTLVLNWSQSAAHDFESYRIYRDTSPGVTPASNLVRQLIESSVTRIEDSGLNDNTRYVYRVYVYDDQDAHAGSNEISVTTDNEAPDPVMLTVTASGFGSISLSWTQSDAHDFQSYRLYRSLNSDNFTALVGTWPNRNQTGHSIAITESDTSTYFFRLTVSDQGINGNPDHSAVSNVVSARGWE